VRVDVDHPHSRQRRLVGDELAQLVERPGVQDAPLRPPSLDPRANTFEILEGKSSLRALSRAHQVLADGVVDVAREALLSPSPTAQQPLG